MDTHEYDLKQATLELLSKGSEVDELFNTINAGESQFSEKEVVETLHEMGFKTEIYRGLGAGWYTVQYV